MLIVLFLVSHFNFLFVPCGGLCWLPVSFLLHVKYTLSYRIVSYDIAWSAVHRLCDLENNYYIHLYSSSDVRKNTVNTVQNKETQHRYHKQTTKMQVLDDCFQFKYRVGIAITWKKCFLQVYFSVLTVCKYVIVCNKLLKKFCRTIWQVIGRK